MTDSTRIFSEPVIVDRIITSYAFRPPTDRSAGTFRSSNTTRVTCARSRPKPKTLTPTGMVIQRSKANGSVFERWVGSYTRYRGDALWCSTTKTLHRRVRNSSSSTNVAYIDAQSRMARGSLNAAQSLAEAKETYGTIVTNLYRLVHFAKKLRRGDITGAARALDIQLSRRSRARLRNQSNTDRMANGWLEFSYGIMPIISDVEGAIELADTQFHKGAVRTSYAGISRAEIDELDDLDSMFKGLSRDQQLDDIYIPERFTLRGEIDNPNLRRAQELGFLNPAALWWELVPLSFVFDWFGTVGSWFDSLTFGAGLKLVQGCRVSYSRTISYSTSTSWIRSDETVSRIPFIPTTATNPFLLRSGKLRGKQIASIAALAKQRFR